MADTADRINQTADTALDAALHGYAELGAQDDRLRRAYEPPWHFREMVRYGTEAATDASF